MNAPQFSCCFKLHLLAIIRIPIKHNHCINYTAELNGLVAAVICFPRAFGTNQVEDNDALQPLCSEQCAALADGFMKNYNVKLKAYISEIFLGSGTLPDVYDTLRAVWQYDRSFLSSFSDVSARAVAISRYVYSVDLAALKEYGKSLAAKHKAGNSVIRKFSQEILQKLVCSEPYTHKHLHMRIHFFIHTLCSALFGNDSAGLEYAERVLEALCYTRDYAELSDAWDKQISWLMLSDKGASSTDAASVAEIMEYIDCNISQSWLSVNSVAEYFCISPSLLSIRFRKQLDTGPLEYINQKRAEYAASLLKHTELSLFEVSQQAGYGSTVTMTRAFKKYYNCPPSVHRRGEKAEL